MADMKFSLDVTISGDATDADVAALTQHLRDADQRGVVKHMTKMAVVGYLLSQGFPTAKMKDVHVHVRPG